MPITIDRVDHVVLNCRDIEVTANWYMRVLGMKRQTFGAERRTALEFGNQKLNLRPTNAANWATAAVDAPGSVDICFITKATPEQTLAHLAACGVAVAAGPTERTGALGVM